MADLPGLLAVCCATVSADGVDEVTRSTSLAALGGDTSLLFIVG